MSKQPPERYYPGNLPDSPDGLIQFLYDELYRIAAAMVAFPAGIGVQGSATVVIDTVPTETRLFDGETPDYEIPGGNWDIPLGEWTIPLTGLYQLNANVVIEPFGAGQFNYACSLRAFVNDVEIYANSNSGADDFSLSVTLGIAPSLQRDDVVRFSIVTQHDQFAGVVDTVESMSMVNVAAA